MIDAEAMDSLVALSDGDARCALNGLEFIINAKLAAAADASSSSRPVVIGDADVRSELIRAHIVYDRLGTSLDVLCEIVKRCIVVLLHLNSFIHSFIHSCLFAQTQCKM